MLNLLSNMGKLRLVLELPLSLKQIHAHGCKEDVRSLLWYCHLNWLRSASQLDLISRPFSVIIPESSDGIFPEWIRYDNTGSEATTKLPMNWYEDPDFLGFVVSCVYQPRHSMHFTCRFNKHGNGFEFKDKYMFSCYCGNLSDHQVWVWWYPYKMAIFKGHHHKFTHFTASFLELWREGG